MFIYAAETGIAIPDEVPNSCFLVVPVIAPPNQTSSSRSTEQDSIAGYVGYGGLIYVVDGLQTQKFL